MSPKSAGADDPSYARQWSFFTVVDTLLAVGVLVSAGASAWFIAIPEQFVVTLGMFIAGFCYRERSSFLVELGP